MVGLYADMYLLLLCDVYVLSKRKQQQRSSALDTQVKSVGGETNSIRTGRSKHTNSAGKLSVNHMLIPKNSRTNGSTCKQQVRTE